MRRDVRGENLPQALLARDPRRLAEDLPFLPLYRNAQVDVLTTRVAGYQPSTEGVLYQNVADWTLR